MSKVAGVRARTPTQDNYSMARHSSFKNLIALETCQNFFLIAGLPTELTSNESEPEHSPVSTDYSTEAEGAIHGLPHPETEGPTANTVETVSTPGLEE